MNCISCNKPNKIYCKKMCSNCYKKQKRDSRPKIPCQCGCGIMIPIISRDGKPNRFVYGHNFGKLENNPNWKGGQYINTKGYRMIYCPDHPYCDKQGYYQEHRRNWELHQSEITGETVYLHPIIKIHHRDQNKLNNHWLNLQPILATDHTRLHKKKDMSDRSCYECKSKETQNDSDGNPVWFKWKYNSFCCKRCYNKIKKRERDLFKKTYKQK